MDLSALLQAFVAILPAELPDKSMFATIVLVTRFHRPLLVWLGVAGAFAIHVVVAVAAGSLLGLQHLGQRHASQGQSTNLEHRTTADAIT